LESIILNKKILIADDSISARMLLKSAFDDSIKQTCEFFEARDGLEAVEVFKKERPDVVFMDLTMPNMNGEEALKEIKKIDANVIVVMITADRQKETKKELVANGAMNVLHKPVDAHELLEICLESGLKS
jgi:two-component system, chemotaxis family, chemotaxis protein CheY